jgi:3',5'-cyclic AMP phosphodiesterase CpdA
MMLLGQISDPHLGPLPPIRARELASKRALGALNWRQNRARTHDDAVLDLLVADMRAARPDHIAVTGDLVNLALPAEFPAARAWLETLGGPHDVSVIPGNHDAYVAGSIERLIEAWRPYLEGDGKRLGFPFVRRRGEIALIGVSTAVPTLPLMATGRVGGDQAAALARALDATGREKLFRVVLIHHPPMASRHWYRRLTDSERVRAALAEHGAELVLHGHDHKATVHHLPGPEAPIPVIGGTAASLRPRRDRAGGAWNLFRIEGGPGAWRVTMSERGATERGTVETIAERELRAD